MSDGIPATGHDEMIRATRLAIARAKRRGSGEVTVDDLVAGLLHAVARFGIVLIGPWTIDMEELGEEALEELDASGPRVSYTLEASALFDRAATVARRDRAANVLIVHMLVAAATEETPLMAKLKSLHGFDSRAWRAALARWEPVVDSHRSNGEFEARPTSVRELLSPDEAADFLGVHTQTVRGYIRSGKLTAHRLAGERAVRIRRQDLIDLLEPYEPD